MKGVLIISTSLALFAAGGVQTHSPEPLSQRESKAETEATAPANPSPSGPTVGQIAKPSTTDRASASAAARTGTAAGVTKAASGSTRQVNAQRTVTTSTTAREARVVPTAMLAPAALPVDSKLVAKIQAMLPDGMAADQAAFGFRTQIQFVSAVFAARNLDVPFAELKTRLLSHGMSLNESIHALRPKADATMEADRALREADAALASAE